LKSHTKQTNTMETNFKGTTGEYYSYFNGQYHEVKREEDHKDNRIQNIHLMLYNDDVQSLVDSKECEANRDLIRDVFNVRQQINVDLPELLKQRDELLELVKEFILIEQFELDVQGGGTYPLLDKAKDLITKIEQK